MFNRRSSQEQAIRILIVDDHDIVRMGLRQLLGAMDGWQVCGEAVDGEQAVAAAAELKPDVIIMDVSMPNMNGIEAAVRIRKSNSSTRIVLLSMHDPVQVAKSAATAGAGVDAFLSKQSVGRELGKVLTSFIK